MTRLLVWANPYWPTVGGGPRLGDALMSALAARGHEVTVLADRRPAELVAREERAGVHIERLPFRQALGGDLAAFTAVRRRVAACKASLSPSLVHLFTLGYAELFHHLTDDGSVPVLATLHRMFPPGAYAEAGIIGRSLRRADWVTACSQSIFDDTCALLPEIGDRGTAIRNALPAPPGRPATPAAHPPRLLCVGVIERRKGFDLAIEALAALRARHPGIRLTIAGDGTQLQALRDQARRLGVAELVTFTGRCEPPQVLDLMRRANVVVMPSRSEPFGLVAVEAGHAGRAIVASRTGGLTEIIDDGDTGRLFPPGDAEALIATLDGMLSDPAGTAQMGQRAFERVRERFDWTTFVDHYDRLIDRLAA